MRSGFRQLSSHQAELQQRSCMMHLPMAHRSLLSCCTAVRRLRASNPHRWARKRAPAVSAAARKWSVMCGLSCVGAEGRIRTGTGVSPLPPEDSVSAKFHHFGTRQSEYCSPCEGRMSIGFRRRIFLRMPYGNKAPSLVWMIAVLIAKPGHPQPTACGSPRRPASRPSRLPTYLSLALRHGESKMYDSNHLVLGSEHLSGGIACAHEEYTLMSNVRCLSWNR